MRRFSFVLFLSLALFTSCRNRVSLTVLETTDTHGHLVEMSDEAVFIKSLRAELGDRLILLDAGDNLQGSEYVYNSNHDTSAPHVVASHFNYLDYDAVAIGNHDIEAGKRVFDRYCSQLNAPALCANVIDMGTGEPYFTPYVTFRRSGYKITVLGLLTPYVVTWVPERLRPGLAFEPVESSAQKWIDIIREKENPDLIIGLLHTGLGGDDNLFPPDSLIGRENSTAWVAANVAGFDLILYGHDHNPNSSFAVNTQGDTVWLLNSGSHGRNLAKASIELETRKHKTVKRIKTEIVPMQEGLSEPDYDHMVGECVKRSEEIQNRVVTNLTETICSSHVTEGPTGWVSLIHRVQFSEAEKNGYKADISFAAALSADKCLEAGPLKVKDFFTIYPFENTLAVLEMTGAEIKSYLEYSYNHYLYDHGPLYNFDSAEGIVYKVERDGDRVRVMIISMSDGTPFLPDKTYRVALNSYRAMGGGGHFTNGLHWSLDDIKKRVVWSGELELRNVFIDWASQFEELDPVPANNWSFVFVPSVS